VENTVVKRTLDKNGKATASERVRAAAGAPGTLLTGDADAKATVNARRMVDAAVSARPSTVHATALAQGSFGARGSFADTLDALGALLGERARDALHRNDASAAAAASKTVAAGLPGAPWTAAKRRPALT